MVESEEDGDQESKQSKMASTRSDDRLPSIRKKSKVPDLSWIPLTLVDHGISQVPGESIPCLCPALGPPAGPRREAGCQGTFHK